jgi:hypothetical protein
MKGESFQRAERRLSPLEKIRTLPHPWLYMPQRSHSGTQATATVVLMVVISSDRKTETQRPAGSQAAKPTGPLRLLSLRKGGRERTGSSAL